MDLPSELGEDQTSAGACERKIDCIVVLVGKHRRHAADVRLALLGRRCVVHDYRKAAFIGSDDIGHFHGTQIVERDRSRLVTPRDRVTAVEGDRFADVEHVRGRILFLNREEFDVTRHH